MKYIKTLFIFSIFLFLLKPVYAGATFPGTVTLKNYYVECKKTPPMLISTCMGFVQFNKFTSQGFIKADKEFIKDINNLKEELNNDFGLNEQKLDEINIELPSSGIYKISVKSVVYDDLLVSDVIPKGIGYEIYENGYKDSLTVDVTEITDKTLVQLEQEIRSNVRRANIELYSLIIIPNIIITLVIGGFLFSFVKLTRASVKNNSYSYFRGLIFFVLGTTCWLLFRLAVDFSIEGILMWIFLGLALLLFFGALFQVLMRIFTSNTKTY